MKSDPKIEDLHQTYVAVSGMDVALRFNRESSWMEFMRSGFTKADLEAVLKRLLALVKTGDRRPECLKFSNVVEGLDRFEEELAMIKAEGNGIKVVERPLSVMELYRVSEAKEDECRTLVNRYTNEDAFGLHWTDRRGQDRYRQLRSEIQMIRDQIASMA